MVRSGCEACCIPSLPVAPTTAAVSDPGGVPQAATGRIQAGELSGEPVKAPAPADIGARPITAAPWNAEAFLFEWTSALIDGRETSLAEVYAPKVDYEGIRRRKVSSIADKRVSVHRLMPGARYDLEVFRIPDATEDRYVVEADIRLTGNDPDVQRRMTRRLVQEDPVPHGPDGTFHVPDFTVTWNGERWYWEHWRLMENGGYRHHRNAKVGWYAKHFPGGLIETFEGPTLSVDADSLIERHFA